MKKIILLCCFLCGMVFAGGAMAVSQTDCYNQVELFDVDGGLEIKVFFKVNEAVEKAGCSDYFKTLKNDLTNYVNLKDVAGFVVLGSASQSNTSYSATSSKCKGKVASGNEALGCDRAEFIVQNILPDSVKNNVRYGNQSATNYKVQVFNMADVNDKTYYNKSNDTNNQQEISASIYVVPAGITCGDSGELKQAINVLNKHKSDSKFPDVCKEVLEYCQSGSDLDLITKQQFGNINKCMKELINLGFDTGDWDLWVKIDGLYKKLDGLLAGLSVWKNAEGKFNTSRLLSDSVAAVVLGTTSGVITSTLVKKNQIKKGFESLRCMVGGQPVADYGDEFVVGATATAYSR